MSCLSSSSTSCIGREKRKVGDDKAGPHVGAREGAELLLRMGSLDILCGQMAQLHASLLVWCATRKYDII